MDELIFAVNREFHFGNGIKKKNMNATVISYPIDLLIALPFRIREARRFCRNFRIFPDDRFHGKVSLADIRRLPGPECREGVCPVADQFPIT